MRSAMMFARAARVGGTYIPNRFFAPLFMLAFVLSAEDNGNAVNTRGFNILNP